MNYREVTPMLTHDQICAAIQSVAEKYHIRNAFYFGSYARGTQTEVSDLDLLVEFSWPEMTLYDRAELLCDLEEMLNIKIDLVKLPLPVTTRLEIDKAVKCYGNTRTAHI